MMWPVALLRIATAWRPAMNATISGASSFWICVKSCLAFMRSAAPPASRPQPGYSRATSRNVRMTFGALPDQNESQSIPLDGSWGVGARGEACGPGGAGVDDELGAAGAGA